MVAVVTTVLTIAGVAIALATARRAAPVRLWLDATRIAIALATTVLLGVLLGVTPSPLLAAPLFALGLALGWWQGTTSEVIAHDGVLLQRRRLAGVAAWGCAVLAVQLAAYASLVGVVSVGQSLAWFGVGAQAALPLGRQQRIREASGVLATTSIAAIAALGVAVLALAAPGVASAQPGPVADGVYTGELAELDGRLYATNMNTVTANEVVLHADGGRYRLDIVLAMSGQWSEGRGPEAFVDCSGSTAITFSGAADGVDPDYPVRMLPRGIYEVRNDVSCADGASQLPQFEDHTDEAYEVTVWVEPERFLQGALLGHDFTLTGASGPLAVPDTADAAATGPDEPPPADESVTAAAVDDTAGIVLTRRQADRGAMAGATGALLFGALSLVDVAGGRRRRVFVEGDPAVGEIVDVDESDRYDLYATSGEQTATGKQRFGPRGRVVGSDLHVEDAEAGADGTRRRLSEVEVTEVAPGPDGEAASTAPDPSPSHADGQSGTPTGPATAAPTVEDIEPDGPRPLEADGPSAPQSRQPPAEQPPAGDDTPGPDTADEAHDADEPAGGDHHPPPVAPTPDPATDTGADEGGLRLSEREIEEAVTRARLGGWENDELQRYLDGLNETRGGTGTVPMPDIEAVELPDGRRVVATAEEIAVYRDTQQRLEQWERYDAYVFEQYQQADAAKRRWVELQAAPEIRFLATMKQVLGEVGEFNARITADERAIERLVAERYDGLHPREFTPGTRQHWEASQRLDDWMRHEVDVRERLDRIEVASEERDWRVRQMLGTPGDTPRGETDTSEMRPVNRMWERINRMVGNTSDREFELPDGTSADETSMAHRPGMKIAELEEVIDGLIAERRDARAHMDELRNVIHSFENPADAASD